MKAPFFITGEQRSGTTLLSVLLAKHSKVHIDGNSHGFRIVTCFNNLNRVLPFNLHHSNQSIQSWLVENDYKGRLAQLIDYENLGQFSNVQEAILEGMQRRMKNTGKEVFGDKSPGLHMFVPDLCRIMPSAKIIHVVRDGRSVAWSKHNRAKRNLKLAAYDWFEGNIMGLTNQILLGNERHMIVRFEDILESPEPTIKRICNFLSIPFEEKVIKDQVSEIEKESSYVKSGFDKDKIDEYVSNLTEKQINRIEKYQAPLLKKFGYTLHKELKSEKAYKEMPVLYHIYLTHCELFRKLLISKQEGMTNRQTYLVHLPLKARLKNLIYWSAYSLLPKRAFMQLFRKRYIKNLYMDKI